MAENTVDTLRIEIEADARKAAKEIKAFAKTLQSLDSGKIEFGFSGLDSVVTNLSKVTVAAKHAVAQIQKLNKEYMQLAKLHERIAAAKTASANLRKSGEEAKKAAGSYSQLVVEGKNLEEIVERAANPKGVKELAEESKKAAINVSEVGDALKKATNWQEAYNTAVAHGVPEGVAAQFANRHFSPPGTAEKTTKGALTPNYAGQAKNIVQVSSQADILKKKIDGLYGKLAKALEAGASQDSIASYISQIQRLEKELQELGRSSSTAKKAAKETSSAFKDLANSARGFVKLGISKAANSFKNSFAGINKQLNYFGAAIKTVLVYSTLSRMLGAITKAVQTGTGNLYQYSKIIDGKFAASMDRLASSFQYFQNSIGAAIAPIINAFAPAIDLAVDKVVELINAFNQMIAKLTGASSWTKAVKVPKEYAEAAGEAEKANKGLLASFDELNVIQSQSGSGSSASTPDYGSMFEEVPLDGYTLPDFVQQIKDKIKEGDWAGVGQTLGEKVNEITSSVNWSELGAKVGEGLQGLIDAYNGFMETVDWTQIGTGLGDALNNLMANVDPESVGAAFAQVWNAITETIYGFVTATDWTAVGKFIAGTINGWFDTVDWTLLGKTVSDGVLSLLEALRSAVQETDWKSIGSSISEMLNQIEWSELFSDAFGLASDSVEGLLDLLIGAVEELDWGKLAEELVDSITGAIASIEFTDIVDKLFELWVAAMEADKEFTKSFWKTIGEKVTEGFEGLFDNYGEDVEEAGYDIGDRVLFGLLDKWNGIGEWIGQHIATPFIEQFKKRFGINSPSTVMAEQGGYLIDGLLGGLKDTWNTVTAWFTDSVSWVKTKLTGGFTDIKNSVVEIWDGLWGGVKSVINSMLGGVEKMANGIVKGINKIISTFNTLSFDIPDWVPGIGGESFGFSIPLVQEVKIPRLASGGVVTSPTFAQIGEYPGAASNPEIVAPQSVIYDTVVSANGEQERLLREQNSLLRQLLQKETSVVLAPSAALGRVNQRSQQMYEALAGGY